MNRKDLIRNTSVFMRENGMRKPVSQPGHVFHISDDEGNSKDFVVRKSEKTVMYTVEDIDAVLTAFIEVIQEAVKHGDPVFIRDFGTLELRRRKGKTLNHVLTGEKVYYPAGFALKFTAGKALKVCAKIFEASINEKLAESAARQNTEDGD